MESKKNKGLIFIIISIVALIPNLGGLLVACLLLDSPPLILYIVTSTMLLASFIGLIYGIALRKKTT